MMRSRCDWRARSADSPRPWFSETGAGTSTFWNVAPNPLEGRGTGIVVHPNTVRYLLERAGRPIGDMGLPAHRAVLPFTSADANARAMSSELTAGTEGSVLASSASWAGATVGSRRARSRLQAMTTLRA